MAPPCEGCEHEHLSKNERTCLENFQPAKTIPKYRKTNKIIDHPCFGTNCQSRLDYDDWISQSLLVPNTNSDYNRFTLSPVPVEAESN